MKLISDGLLRQRNGLMIYNKIERVLVITKWIFNYYNTNFSQVQNVNQKYTFTHKLTTKRNFQTPPLFFFSSTVMEWNAQDCGISKAAKDTSMLPSKIVQMKVSHETGSEANFGFGRALMPSYLGMYPPKAAFFSFRMQPWSCMTKIADRRHGCWVNWLSLKVLKCDFLSIKVTFKESVSSLDLHVEVFPVLSL